MKKFLVFILSTIFLVSTMTFIACTPEMKQPSATVTPPAQKPTITMSMGSPMVTTTDTGAQYIEKTLTATVLPETAKQAVDYSVSWGVNAVLSAEPVTDYITVTQESDGSTKAFVRCYKDFGNDNIIITVTTRDGGYSAYCNVTFEGLLRDFTINSPDNIELKNTTERGEYYQLYCGNTYTIDLESKDMFGDVCTGSYTITPGGYGELWMMTRTIKTTTGASADSLAVKQNLAQTTDPDSNVGWNSYFTANINENNQLEITTKSVYMLSGNNIFLRELNDFQLCAFYKETISEEKGYVGGAEKTVTPEEYYNTNQENIPKMYFFVNIFDSASKITKQFKFWIISSVSEVNLNNSTMTFNVE